MPKIIDIIIVFLNPTLNLKADATGITIIEDTTSSPTTFIDADMVKLSRIENNILKNEVFILDIFEKSSSNIISANLLEYFVRNIITIILVIIMKSKSTLDSVSMLPNIMLSISILTMLLLDIIIAIPRLSVSIIDRDISEKFL